MYKTVAFTEHLLILVRVGNFYKTDFEAFDKNVTEFTHILKLLIVLKVSLHDLLRLHSIVH